MSLKDQVNDPLINKLFQAILLLRDEEECYKLFEDLCTISEIKTLAQRLEVAKMLDKNYTYTYIAEKTGASTATISRVKRYLSYGASGYSMMLKRLNEKGLHD